MKKRYLLYALFFLLAAGCAASDESIRQAAQPVGRPLGMVQSAPEGVARGYASGGYENPYGR